MVYEDDDSHDKREGEWDKPDNIEDVDIVGTCSKEGGDWET